MPAASEIRADRRLLLPGPQPPLTHLGATLLRYATHSALRYALYQLGQPLPEAPATRFVGLRLYLDAVALGRVLERETAAEVLGALLDPAGSAAGPLPKRLAGVLWFHRRRLLLKTSPLGRLLSGPSRRRRGSVRRTSEDAGSDSPRPGSVLSRRLRALGDALLGDLIAALDRRQVRAAGRTMPPVQSFEAARFARGASADLARLGIPDPLAPSWFEAMPACALDLPAELLAASPGHRLRGGFREEYRRLLDRMRPSLLALGERAVERGYLDSRDDLFFVPFELIDDLDGSVRPVWLESAVGSNRAEWEEARSRPAPAETLGNVEPQPRTALDPDLSPLWPLA